MCFGRPKTPELPEPLPPDSAIEKTASRVVIGSKRKNADKQTIFTSETGRGRMGTQSLQIPFMNNLNYPT